MKTLTAFLAVMTAAMMIALMAVTAVNVEMMQLIENGSFEMTELRKSEAKTRSELLKVREAYERYKQELQTATAKINALESELERALFSLGESLPRSPPAETPRLYSPAFIPVGYRILRK